MSRKNKRNRNKYIKPDEAMSIGPLQVGRFGRNIVYQSNWQEGDFEKFQKELASNYADIVSTIDALVLKISNLIARTPPSELMKRAWWEYANSSLLVETEAEVGPDEAHAMRMIDYVQSMIAATKPSETQAGKVSEEDWADLNKYIKELFDTINYSYSSVASAKNRLDNPEIDEFSEMFHVRSRMYWCNVRGKRYQSQNIQAMNDVLLAQTEQVEAIYGVSAEQIIDGLAKISYSLTFGLGEAAKNMDDFRKKTLTRMSALTEAVFETPQELMAEVMKDDALRAEGDTVFYDFMGLGLFDLERITDLPKNLLDDFSWTPGQNMSFLSEGEFRGWPLRVWPTFQRPFLKLDNKHYCFDEHSLYDHFYRQIEKRIFNHSEVLKQQWISNRKHTTEDLPAKYLKKLLPGSEDFGEVYYRWNTGEKGQLNWCETDRIITYDNTIFIIEVKAGSFTWTAPDQDIDAYINSIRNLVETPSIQGDRFIEYLNSSEEVSLYNRSHVEITKIKISDFDNIIKCAVTLDSFTEIAAQTQHLKKLNVGLTTGPVWSMSIDDLRVYAEVFSNSLEFIHFVTQRNRALASQQLQLDDELDHLGLYLKHNNYAQYADEMNIKKDTHLNFHGYRSDIDRFFAAKQQGKIALNPLKQSMPHRLQEIVTALHTSEKKDRSAIACYALDIAGDWRKKTFGSIDTELKFAEQNGRTRALSTHGDVRITIFPWSIPFAPRKLNVARDHTMALLLLHNEDNRWLIEPVYSKKDELLSVSFEQISLKEITESELQRLQELSEKLRSDRLEKRKRTSKKIGRNESCPCGSGKKYKRCCLV